MSGATTTTTAEVSLISSSGSGEFMALIGIIGGSSLAALGLIALCCRWLIKFTSPEQREVRRKFEFENLQKEQERLMKALLEMNSTEAATQRRADREKQKLIEKMNKQEEIRVRNERMKAKKLKELAYELKKNGTDIVIEGFDSDDDDEVDNAKNGAHAHATDAERAEAAKEAEEEAAKKRARDNTEDEERKRQGEFALDLGDADEGDAILALPPKTKINDKKYFLKSTIDEAAAEGRLVPSQAKSQYFKSWEQKPEKKQRFVSGTSSLRVMPRTSDECPKPPKVVYDEASDEFVYMSQEDYDAKKEAERERQIQSVEAREREERLKASKRKGGGPNFDEMDDDADQALPPLQPAWTENTNELPLARAHTAVRSAREVKIEKARFQITDASSMI